MIYTIIILAFILFFLYNEILRIFPISKATIYKNKERAEEFIYSKKCYSVIVAGSGLSGNFSAKCFQREDQFNLYFPYNGSCTGVEIIALSNKIPHTLFIETNYIFKGFDKKLINDLFKPGLYEAKFILPSLLEKHKIAPLIKQLIKPSKPLQINKNKLSPILYSEALENHKKTYNNLPDDLTFKKNVDQLKKHIEYLSSKGCKIIFFEMPLDHHLETSPLAIFQRNALKSIFNDNHYKWIISDGSFEYDTEDGIHLLAESTERFYERLEIDNKYC